MMVGRRLKLLLVLVLLFSLFGSGFQGAVAAVELEKKGSLTVIGIDENTSLEKTDISLGENTTAFNALIEKVGEDNVGYDSWKFINSIFGLEAPEDYSKYWAVYVNGIPLPVGANDYVMQNGDDLTFVYTDFASQLKNTVSLMVYDKDGKLINQYGDSISIMGQPTALQLLQIQLGNQNVLFHIDATKGIMIDSIQGLVNNETNVWKAYVNGNAISGGIENYILQNGDKITYKYESNGEPIEETKKEEPKSEEQSSAPIDPAIVQSAIDSAITQIPLDSLEEWGALALKQAGKTVPATYLARVTKEIQDANGKYRKITDYERYTLGILAAGGDPTNVGGYNLVSSIYNGNVTMQGLNGVGYALIALDSANFEIPANATWTREKLVRYILDNQNDDGSWPGADESSINDYTAIVLTSLAPYKDQAEVSGAINKAVNYLSAQFNSGKIDNSMTASQIIIALSSLKIDPNGSLFTKDSSSIVSFLLSFQNQDKGFSWKKTNPSDLKATIQAVHALSAYQRYVNGKVSLFTLPNTPQGQAVVSSGEGEGKLLPNTATNELNIFVIGLFLMVIGMVTLVINNRRKA